MFVVCLFVVCLFVLIDSMIWDLDRPIYTGFFFKIWDYVFDSNNTGTCGCVKCRPARTREQWEKTVKPDYSVLLSPSWWWSEQSAVLGAGEDTTKKGQ